MEHDAITSYKHQVPPIHCSQLAGSQLGFLLISLKRFSLTCMYMCYVYRCSYQSSACSRFSFRARNSKPCYVGLQRQYGTGEGMVNMDLKGYGHINLELRVSNS